MTQIEIPTRDRMLTDEAGYGEPSTKRCKSCGQTKEIASDSRICEECAASEAAGVTDETPLPRCPGCEQHLFEGHTAKCASGCGKTFCESCIDSFYELCKGCTEKNLAEHARRMKEDCIHCQGIGKTQYFFAGKRSRIAECGFCHGSGKRSNAA